MQALFSYIALTTESSFKWPTALRGSDRRVWYLMGVRKKVVRPNLSLALDA